MPKNVAGVMHEFKHGQLHSGKSSGPKVTNPKQAIAIALSEQRQMPASDPLQPAPAANERPSIAALKRHGQRG